MLNLIAIKESLYFNTIGTEKWKGNSFFFLTVFDCTKQIGKYSMFCQVLNMFYCFPVQVQWRRDPVQPNGHRIRQEDDIWEKDRRAPDPAYWGEW